MAAPTTSAGYDKSKALLTAALVVFAAVAVVVAAAWWFIRKPHFDGHAPLSIAVLLHQPRPVNATSPPAVLLSVTLTNEQTCSNLLGVLRQGRLRRDHTCAPVGTIAIKFANGKTNEVHLLPTHASGDAEFRIGVLKFKVKQDQLYPALDAAGVDTSRIPAAGH